MPCILSDAFCLLQGSREEPPRVHPKAAEGCGVRSGAVYIGWQMLRSDQQSYFKLCFDNAGTQGSVMSVGEGTRLNCSGTGKANEWGWTCEMEKTLRHSV